MTNLDDPDAPLFTIEEILAIRAGVMAGVNLVADADPGFWARMKEMLAASHAISDGSPLQRSIMQDTIPAPLMSLPDVPADPVERARYALAIGDRKGDEIGGEIRALMLRVTRAVGLASDGLSSNEQAVIDRIVATADTGLDPDGVQPPPTAATAAAPADGDVPTRYEQPPFSPQPRAL